MSSGPIDHSPWQFWQDQHNLITSKKGGWRIGEAVYNHGYSMMDDLIGEISWFQLLVLNTTGKLPDKKLAEWLENCFACLSWPDSRIWCNQVAALAGSSQTRPVSAIAAGVMASDAYLYGPGVIQHCQTFIQSALGQEQAGATPKQIIEDKKHSTGSIPGYARPIAKGDERVSRMRQYSRDQGFTIGPHEALALRLSEYLVIHENESINFGGYMAAFLADQGITDPDSSRIFALWVSAGLHACYAETCDNPPGSYLPLRCDDMIYNGKAPRQLP